MARIRVTRFSRVAAAFDEAARVRLYESSGSEHSPELSDLVNSFIERGGSEEGDIIFDDEEIEHERREVKELERDIIFDEGSDGSYNWPEPAEKKKDVLKNLLIGNENDGDDDHMIKRKIGDEVEVAYGMMIGLGDKGSQGFKRRLMTHLREKGFDAGLCKSKWEKSKRFPAGDYEYVDVNVQGTRYIVEAFLVGEFEIARPTDHYASLLEIFPRIFVGKVAELKQIVRLMCTAIKQSMKSREMPMPPWRRNAYMQTKWFGPYRRTTNSLPSKKASKLNEAFDAKRSVGFETLPIMPYFCRGDLSSSRVGLRVGNLTAAFNG